MFQSRYGHFEFQVILLIFVNRPATFQVYINSIFQDYLDDEYIA